MGDFIPFGEREIPADEGNQLSETALKFALTLAPHKLVIRK